MKEATDAYVRTLEARVRHYQARMETVDHDRNYPAAIALARVVADFTGEDRWAAFDRIQQERLASK